MVCTAMSNGPAERMVRTMKSAVGKVVSRKLFDWELAILRVLHGYRSRGLPSGYSLFQLLYRVSSRMQFEHLLQYRPEGLASGRKIAKVHALASYRLTHVSKINSSFHHGTTSKKLGADDSVLDACGTALSSVVKRPSFLSTFYGPCIIVNTSHSRLNLTGVAVLS